MGKYLEERQASSSANDETGIDLDFVASNLNRTVTLIGSNLAIFTFVLVFLYPRYASNPPQLNGVLFKVTLTSSLMAIFLFGIAGVYYLEVVGVAKNSVARKRALIQRGDALFVLSLLLGTAMPALILFTLGIMRVAIIATILWALYAGFITQQGRKLRPV
jgi:hypothetical protein